jgi:hypothetical protein
MWFGHGTGDNTDHDEYELALEEFIGAGHTEWPWFHVRSEKTY